VIKQAYRVELVILYTFLLFRLKQCQIFSLFFRFWNYYFTRKNACCTCSCEIKYILLKKYPCVFLFYFLIILIKIISQIHKFNNTRLHESINIVSESSSANSLRKQLHSWCYHHAKSYWYRECLIFMVECHLPYVASLGQHRVKVVLAAHREIPGNTKCTCPCWFNMN